ncbi:L-serine ammonia-lyase [Dictyostelium discoideum AX4]|uniref:L-serine dehydratase n=1 Tax=Dictyostelium discoideum TaxID=44689 RepID=SDHL_DICDI|nr:L-serine ammonia-lyase [Dictyostelium discoideum AX4]Q86B06.1 RecName: Full=L-serine dehydratase; Short=SDH; AltName: Full=L-serine deaminase [Dictyostelium discoideum]EAL71031.1 L-serine ammonia-lyase [Dictyostelium discoideum AX4]|eukprot:XP_644969.1 L-serine ammonia-lyase [Dictyostelium discoideum AX4]
MGLKTTISPDSSFDKIINTKTSPPLHINSPMLESLALSKLFKEENAKVWMKVDALQPSGSFKIRGVGLLCNQLLKEKKSKNEEAHFICSSGGNAGKSVAYAGRKLNVKTTIVLPNTIPEATIEKIKDEGANVIVHGTIWDEANTFALELAEKEGCTDCYIHPFDHPLLWEGHSTMIDEIYQDVQNGVCEKPDVILFSVGGGGMMIGILQGLDRYGWNDIPIVTVETVGSHSFWKSFQEKQLTKLDVSEVTSVIKTLSTRSVCSEAWEISKRFNIKPILVTDRDAVDACLKFVDDERILVEPSCGATLSVLYSKKLSTLLDINSKNILTIVCGGNGTSILQLNDLLQTLPK